MSKKLGASTGRNVILLLVSVVLVALLGGVVYGVLEETGAIISIRSMIGSLSSASENSDVAGDSQQSQQQASSIVAQMEDIDQAMESNLQEQEYWHEKSRERLDNMLWEVGKTGTYYIAGWVKAQENIVRLQNEYHQLLQDKLDLILELQLALY